MRFRTVKFSLFASLFLFCGLALAATSPLMTMQAVAKKMLTYLEQHQSELSGNPQLIHRIVDQVLMPVIDTNRMGGAVVGRRYWQQATSAQRSEFIKQFKRLVVNTYSSALASYDDDQIRFYPLRRGAASGRTVQVQSLIVRKNGQRVPIIYNLVNSGGGWKVYDFSIENVSIVQSYRSQFAGILSRGGLTDLIKRLKTYNRR